MTEADRAAKLPAPAVGVVVKVPLEAWPEYARLHRLEVVGGDKKTCTVICRKEKA